MMSILSILLGHILYSSDALILNKFRNVTQHYLKNERQVMLSHFLNGSTFHDPLDNFGLQKRIELCDDLLNAKQFLNKDPWPSEKRRPRDPVVRPVKWNLAPSIPANTLNYQRLISDQRGGDDSPVLQYYERCLRVGTHVYRMRKRLQCVRTRKTKWFVTHGWEDNVLYLLEHHSERGGKDRIRLAGIFEPSAELDQRGFEYFENQFQEHQAEMETAICALGAEDVLRLCSAVFDTLSTEGSLNGTSRLYYVKKETRRCVMRDIEIGGTMFKSYFLRCHIMHGETDDEPSSLFSILADTSELGAVFVFFERLRGRLKLHARLVRIRALTSPVGLQIKSKIVTPDHQIDKEETVHVVNRAETIPSWRERENVRKLKQNVYRADKRSRIREHSKSKRATKKRKRVKHHRCTKLEEDEHETGQEEYQGSSDKMNSLPNTSVSGGGRKEGSSNRDIQLKEKGFIDEALEEDEHGMSQEEYQRSSNKMNSLQTASVRRESRREGLRKQNSQLIENILIYEALESSDEQITPRFNERTRRNKKRRDCNNRKQKKQENIGSSHRTENDGNEEELEPCSNRKMKKLSELSGTGGSSVSIKRNESSRSEGEMTSRSLLLMPERWGKRVKRSSLYIYKH